MHACHTDASFHIGALQTLHMLERYLCDWDGLQRSLVDPALLQVRGGQTSQHVVPSFFYCYPSVPG